MAKHFVFRADHWVQILAICVAECLGKTAGIIMYKMAVGTQLHETLQNMLAQK